jgi:large subunit ribosomal protein L13Ae
MGFEREIVIDCKGHLLGRLAAIVAKQLLMGQKIVAVRTEEINISGPLDRNRKKFQDFLRKTANTNPRRGPRHFRSPSKMFWRTVRGMLPHKQHRGAQALRLLTVAEGVPPAYAKVRRATVPGALRMIKLRPGRKFTRLGDLASLVGWKYASVVEALETKRKLRSKKQLTSRKPTDTLWVQARKKALANPSIKTAVDTLNKLGYVSK